MATVTKRINEVKQPRGGYLKPSSFECHTFDDGKILSENENVNPINVGLAVDYLTRLVMGASAEKAFSISLRGAMNASTYGMPYGKDLADDLLSQITGIDENSIICACKMTAFDVWYRNLLMAPMSVSPSDINPDEETIRNIQIMVERSISFWHKYGPIVKDGFTFEPDGYTKTVSAGDGDFLTKDTLWDFKVSKKKATSKNTLQILMYWIMGQHSDKTEFDDITNIGIFNPRLNTAYTLPISKVDQEIIEIVETDVLCY